MRPVILIFLLSVVAGGALADPESLRSEADEATAAGDIDLATAKLRELISLAPEDGAAHFAIAGLLMDNGGNAEEAARHFERAGELQYRSLAVAYRLSRLYARAGRNDDALEQLESLAAGGFGVPNLIDGETDYNSIRDDDRFSAALSSIRAARYPCAVDERHHAFDFWIGEWRVSQNGQFAGTNKIEPILGHCTIFEQWESSTGSLGKSFNYYDPGHDHWRQIWIADDGSFIEFTGEARDGGIFYTAETIDPADGSVTHHQFTFTQLEDGSVRQHWQTSTDGGETWAVVWNGRYEKTASSNRFSRITSDWADPVFRQYDFWIGVGKANWRSKNPDEFFHEDVGLSATHWVYPTLNGKALLEFAMSDEPVDDNGARLQGFSVRYYDEAKERWVMAQEWPDQNSTNGFTDQLQGRYRFGRIEMFSTYTRGEPEVERTRRYTFSDIGTDGFIWHGVFSSDKGNSWNAGTLVEFSKLAADAQWPEVGHEFPNYDHANQCNEDAYRAFDDLAGAWHGTASIGGERRAAALTGYLMLGGCAVLSYLEFERDDVPYTLLEVRGMGQDDSDWWVHQLDDQRGTPHSYQIGRFKDREISLYENNQYVIADELQNLTPNKIAREDDNALKKTVWTELSSDALAFEWWARQSADAEWRKDAEFEFERYSK